MNMTAKYRYLCLILGLLGLVLVGLGCGGPSVGNEGDTVGGPCLNNDDCAERCVSGGDYPQGTCTVACDTDEDCPVDTYCINHEGGICLLGCDRPSDCRGGYTCKGEENRGHGGDSLVCIAD